MCFTYCSLMDTLSGSNFAFCVCAHTHTNFCAIRDTRARGSLQLTRNETLFLPRLRLWREEK